MSEERPAKSDVDRRARSARLVAFALAAGSAAVYLALALAGDLRPRPAALLSGHVALLAAMIAAWTVWRRSEAAGAVLLGAALLFRLVAALGAPALSDDVYRYVWDGRVQLHGIHPYAHAPADPALEALRDEDWSRINHPHLKTIYPPLAQAFFLALAALGAGPDGFRLALGLADFGVVLALARLLAALGLPRDRLALYAWNPLAVLETAGSGHVEPLGVGLAVLAAAWIIARRESLSTLALAGAVQVKLLPLALVPGYVRRWRFTQVAVFAGAVAALWLPYAATGPPLGAGLGDYAARWEHNASVFALLRHAFERLDTGEALVPAIARAREVLGAGFLPWERFYAWAWPGPLARLVVALAALAWIARLTFRPRLDAARETFLVLGGLLVLSPTVHPWYVLWVLPFAAAYLSWPWLTFAALVVLTYAAPGAGWVVWVEYGALGAAAAVGAMLGRRRAAGGRA